jgi:hypothetical protein
VIGADVAFLLGIGLVVGIVWWLNDLPDERNDWRRK